MATNPEWSGYLNIAIMDKTGSIMIHNRHYDLDKDDPDSSVCATRMGGRTMMEQVEYYTAQRLRLKVDRLIKQTKEIELQYLYFLHRFSEMLSEKMFYEYKKLEDRFLESMS